MPFDGVAKVTASLLAAYAMEPPPHGIPLGVACALLARVWIVRILAAAFEPPSRHKVIAQDMTPLGHVLPLATAVGLARLAQLTMSIFEAIQQEHGQKLLDQTSGVPLPVGMVRLRVP